MRRRRTEKRETHGFLGKSRVREERKPREAAQSPNAKRRAREDAPVPDDLRLSSHSHRPAPASGRAAGPAPVPSHPAPRNRGNDPGARRVVLVTGFEPFGGETTNPSWEICERLPAEIGGMRVETCRVPCEFRHAIEVVADAIQRHEPALVVSIGQAGGRSRIGVERVAINLDDARIADNAGVQPIDEPIAAGGPPAYFATLPVKAMAQAIRSVGVPAEVSNTAGTYVCNHVMYGVLHFLAASGLAARAGFIHVPYEEGQVLDKPNTAAMSIESMVKGIAAAIDAAARRTSDIATAEGALD